MGMHGHLAELLQQLPVGEGRGGSATAQEWQSEAAKAAAAHRLTAKQQLLTRPHAPSHDHRIGII